MNMNLAKIIDRLEPLDDGNSSYNGTTSKYYGNVEETIHEVNSDGDEEFDKKSRLSHSSRSSNR